MYRRAYHRKGVVMSLPLDIKILQKEATSGATVLAYREDMWLNLTCMISGMLFLQKRYSSVGVVNPSFYHRKEPVSRIKMAMAFNAFEASKQRVVGVVNASGVHWTAYCTDRCTTICYTFDPALASTKKMTKAIREVVEPLLHLDGVLSNELMTWCKQRDGSQCCVLCFAVQEL
ncbi:hypothetical protein PHMEG_00027008 [Phytophthora megakarya]|uniref:Ubiquitin-like protease family profile domain-containing protein n=1 Tax=Phytophthora megakarya TaxID=4795 RepID=A0A225V871_9STRA|nr:hypothetical protein PHMEG_00027008 [Phytophthora megakarya]